MTAPATAKRDARFAIPDSLRQQLTTAPRPDSRPLATGIAALDALLPDHGVPRGRLTEVVGERGSGKTMLVRHLVETTVAQGHWVAYVDMTRTLAPRDWAHVGRGADPQANPFVVVRPPDPRRGAWCADVLLRSGAFALVVLDGGTESGALLGRAVSVRLTRLARDVGAALVVLHERRAAAGEPTGSGIVGSALRLVVARAAPVARHGRWRALVPLRDRRRSPQPPDGAAVRLAVVTVEKGGVRRTVEVKYVAALARRVCAHPEVPDRRGVARSGVAERRGWVASDGAARAAARPIDDPGAPRLLPRKRRCAEPSLEPRGAVLPAPGEHRASTRKRAGVG